MKHLLIPAALTALLLTSAPGEEPDRSLISDAHPAPKEKVDPAEVRKQIETLKAQMEQIHDMAKLQRKEVDDIINEGQRLLAPVRAVIDDTQPGWRDLTKEDFTKVNSADDTWTWKEGGLLVCTGKPVSVMRTVKEYKNFEMVVEWCHQKPAGNSGVFVWATPASIEKLTTAGKPGLPDGIEVQVLDHAFTDQMKAAGKATDWFGTNGDVFPVRVKMTPFPPTSPNGERSFPRKHLSKGHGEWNHYYIRAINGEIRLWVNGEEVSGGNGCDPAQGYLCLESEGSPIHFRHLRIRELP